MSDSVVPVEVKAVIPASGGCAVFLGNEEKVFVIYIDQMVGMAIAMFLRGKAKERPLTHDLMANLMLAYDMKVDRVIVTEFRENIYFAQLHVSASNELHHQKVIHLDSRPSDAIALAVRSKAPIYVANEIWEAATDDSHVLKIMQDKGKETGPILGSWSADDDEIPF